MTQSLCLFQTNMNNAVIPISEPIPDSMNIHQRIRRGRAIALLYIAAQHLSQVASDDACRLIEEANDPWQNHGFNQQMRKSPFGTRAQGAPTRDWLLPPESKEMRDARIRRMTTPDWMRDPADLTNIAMPWNCEPANYYPL